MPGFSFVVRTVLCVPTGSWLRTSSVLCHRICVVLLHTAAWLYGLFCTLRFVQFCRIAVQAPVRLQLALAYCRIAVAAANALTPPLPRRSRSVRFACAVPQLPAAYGCTALAQRKAAGYAALLPQLNGWLTPPFTCAAAAAAARFWFITWLDFYGINRVLHFSYLFFIFWFSVHASVFQFYGWFGADITVLRRRRNKPCRQQFLRRTACQHGSGLPCFLPSCVLF